jgi:hypothetical protein
MHIPEMISLCEKSQRATRQLLSERLLRLRLGIVQDAKSACFIAAHVENLD